MYNFYQYNKTSKEKLEEIKKSLQNEKTQFFHNLKNEDLKYNHNIRLKKFLHQLIKSPVIIGEKKVEKEKEKNEEEKFSLSNIIKHEMKKYDKRVNNSLQSEAIRFTDEYYKKELEKIKLEKKKKEEEKSKKRGDDDFILNSLGGNKFYGSITNEIFNQVKDKSQENPNMTKKKKGNIMKNKRFEASEDDLKYKTYFQSIKTIALSKVDQQDKINIEKFKTKRKYDRINAIEESSSMQVLETNTNKKEKKSESSRHKPVLSQHNLKRISMYSSDDYDLNDGSISEKRKVSIFKNYNYKQNKEIEKYVLNLKASVPEVIKINPSLLDLKVDYYDNVNVAYINEYDKEKYSQENLMNIKKLFHRDRITYYDKLFKSKAMKKNSIFTNMLHDDPKKYFKVFSAIEAQPINKGNEMLEIDGKSYSYNEIKQISKVLLRKCRVIN